MNSGIQRAILSITFLFAFTLAHAQLLPPIEFDANGAAHLRGEVLVQFKPEATDGQIEEAFQRGQLNLLRHVLTPAMQDAGRMGVTRALTSMPVHAALRALNNLPGIEFAQPNFAYTTQADANDPLYLDGLLWGLYGDDSLSPVGPPATTNPFGSQAEKAWAAGILGSADVFVGVVDQGIQFDHPDLAANLWTNPGEIPGNGIDDDSNGYVDDVHGWNAIDDNGMIFNPASDRHGTHVAGTIGAVGGNGVGVVGVNWNVTIISGKFLGTNGSGSTLDALQAIDYMTTLRIRKGLNIVALNNSWGTGSGVTPDQALFGAVARAASAGILFVAAAMNWSTNIDASPVYPACFDTTAAAGYDSVISVAALESTGARRVSSDYGQVNVDLGAPGGSIFSTVPPGGYALMSGTSMATPHVAGALALYASTHPAATPWQAKADLLTYGVRPTESLSGITATGGRLDTFSFLQAPAEVLAPPLTPAVLNAVVISGGRIDLTWIDYADNELGFAIERSSDGQNFFLADTVGASIANYSDRTALPGATYYYRIRAYNPGGSSGYAYASSAVMTPQVLPPAAPSGLTASAMPKGGVKLAWVDPSNNEDGFQIERKTGTGAWQLIATVAANTVMLTDNSTAARTTYSYRLRAFNVGGASAYSNQVTVKTK